MYTKILTQTSSWFFNPWHSREYIRIVLTCTSLYIAYSILKKYNTGCLNYIHNFWKFWGLRFFGFCLFVLRDTVIIWLFPKWENTVYHFSCSKQHPVNHVQWCDLLLFPLSRFGDGLLQWVAFRTTHVEQHSLKSCQLYGFLLHAMMWSDSHWGDGESFSITVKNEVICIYHPK